MSSYAERTAKRNTLPRDYASGLEYLGRKDSRPLANNTRLERRPDGVAVRLHGTDVVTWLPDGRVRMDSGGWRTVTTRQRMTQFSPFNVGTERGVMYVSARPWGDAGRKEWPFADGMTCAPGLSAVEYRDGVAPDPKADIRLGRAIGAYAKAFGEAVAAGKVEQPSLGDCWGCSMRTADGQNPMGRDGDHLRQHIAEGYYVPSLLSLARDFRPWPPALVDYVARRMAGVPAGWPGDGYGKREVAKAVRSYMRHALGLSA